MKGKGHCMGMGQTATYDLGLLCTDDIRAANIRRERAGAEALTHWLSSCRLLRMGCCPDPKLQKNHSEAAKERKDGAQKKNQP